MAVLKISEQSSKVQDYPVVLSPVTFHGDTIFCIDYHNQPYTPAKPIVENIGLAWQSQCQKLNMNRERWGITNIVIPTSSGSQQMLCLPVRKLPAYLASINPKKVRPELRTKIELYQAESDDALWNYWMHGRAERTAASAPAPHALPCTGTGTETSLTSRTIASYLHKRHSTVLDAIGRAAAVCPQQDAFVRGSYVDAKGQRRPQYMVSREGIIFLSQSYAARQTDAWRSILEIAGQAPVVAPRADAWIETELPNTRRLFRDIHRALDALQGTRTWSDFAVKNEIATPELRDLNLYNILRFNIDTATCGLGMAERALKAAVALKNRL